MTSEGHRALLPANVDRRPLLQRGLMNFRLQFFQLYNKSLKDWSVGKQLVLFPSGPVIKGTQSKRIRNTLNKACRVELVTSRNRDYRP